MAQLAHLPPFLRRFCPPLTQKRPRAYRGGQSRCRFCVISLTQRFQAERRARLTRLLRKQYFPIA